MFAVFKCISVSARGQKQNKTKKDPTKTLLFPLCTATLMRQAVGKWALNSGDPNEEREIQSFFNQMNFENY